LKKQRKNPSLAPERLADVFGVDAIKGIYESLSFAEFVLGSWLKKGIFPE
jgi:hypothetical protein